MQDYPDGTGKRTSPGSGYFRDRRDRRVDTGEATWVDVLMVDVTEALEAPDPAALRGSLERLIGTAGAWIEALDKRKALGAITQADWAANTDRSDTR